MTHLHKSEKRAFNFDPKGISLFASTVSILNNSPHVFNLLQKEQSTMNSAISSVVSSPVSKEILYRVATIALERFSWYPVSVGLGLGAGAIGVVAYAFHSREPPSEDMKVVRKSQSDRTKV